MLAAGAGGFFFLLFLFFLVMVCLLGGNVLSGVVLLSLLLRSSMLIVMRIPVCNAILRHGEIKREIVVLELFAHNIESQFDYLKEGRWAFFVVVVVGVVGITRSNITLVDEFPIILVALPPHSRIIVGKRDVVSASFSLCGPAPPPVGGGGPHRRRECRRGTTRRAPHGSITKISILIRW